jgi:hypothetical protein
MSVSQINSQLPVSRNSNSHQLFIGTTEEAAALQKALEAPTESSPNQETSDNPSSSQEMSDASVPPASWDAFYKQFDHSIFDHSRRQLAYYDRRRKEVAEDNKP